MTGSVARDRLVRSSATRSHDGRTAAAVAGERVALAALDLGHPVPVPRDAPAA